MPGLNRSSCRLRVSDDAKDAAFIGPEPQLLGYVQKYSMLEAGWRTVLVYWN
jgi:hypothetical protein